MRALSTCIARAGKAISPIETKMLKLATDRYRKEGFSAHESNIGAVSETIAALEDDLQSITAQVRKQAALSVYNPEDDSLMASTPSRFIKLPTAWQDTLKALCAANKELACVDIGLSDGRTIKAASILDPVTVQSDIEVSMQGVTITSMTPGTRLQADDPSLRLPNKTDVYPVTRPEKQAEAEEAQKQRERAQQGIYASVTSELNRLVTAVNSLSTSVSPSTKLMKNIEDLKQLQASVQTADKIDDLRTAFAEVATFAEEIARVSEEQVRTREAAEASAQQAQTTTSEIKAKLDELTTKYNEIVAAQVAAAAEQAYQTRMATVEEVFAFDDEARAELVDEIKACADDESFSRWLTRAKKLFKAQTREVIAAAAEAAKAAAAKDKKEDEHEEDEEKKGKKCEAAAKEVLASAAGNVVDPAITNVIDPAANQPLTKRYAEIFANNIIIDGKTVTARNEEAAKTVKTTS